MSKRVADNGDRVVVSKRLKKKKTTIINTQYNKLILLKKQYNSQRNWSRSDVIHEALKAIEIPPNSIPVLIHGDCKNGADHMAKQSSILLGWKNNHDYHLSSHYDLILLEFKIMLINKNYYF